MKRLLKVFLQNIFKQKGFYVCLGISVAIGLIIPFILGLFIKSNDLNMAFSQRLIDCFKLDIILVIFISLFVCSDFTDGTAKNYIARGYTRRQILYAKYIAILISIFIYFIACMLLTFALYAKDGVNLTSTNILVLVGTCIATMAMAGLYVVIANTAEKLSAGMTFNIIIYSFAGLAFTGIGALLKVKDLENYWLPNIANTMPKNAGIVDLLFVIGIAAIYLVVLFELSNFIIRRKEVK